MNGLESSERAIIQTAHDLREQGYDVEVQPTAGSVPTWLRDMRPDIIARRGEQTIVAEVKTRGEIAESPYLKHLASEVARHPGWSFLLVPVGDESQEVPSAEEVRARAAEASALMRHGFPGPALIGAWAAVEGGLRRLLHRNAISSRSGPAGLIRELYANDLLSDRQFELLTGAVEQRNRLAHGLEAKEPIDQGVVEQLVDLADALASDQYRTVAELVEWFFDHYEHPGQSLPYETAEGGFQWLGRGPHDAEEVLRQQFAGVPEAVIAEATEIIEQDATEWARK